MLKKIFFVLFFLIGFMCNVDAMELRQQMSVQIGVFDAGRIELKYNITDNFYISAEVKTNGFFDSVYPFWGQYEGMGRINKGKVVPKVYKATQKSRSHVRAKQIDYDKNGKAYQRTSIKDEKVSVIKIENMPDNMVRSDLQSVFMEMILRYKNTLSCQGKTEVYDGKKHYMAVFRDEGLEERFFDFAKKKESAHKCSMYIQNLKQNNDNILWNVSSDRPIYLWLKRDEKTKNPYLMEINIDSTPLGALKVTPSVFEIK